ncbi:MSP domain protein [Dictyocaulus viviparus]|uniref:MSP domain protein n=1 Tax=Dictyocaulus viviparus TaxID=29172 RepID=A0A0D8XXF2_DICVI|nr:MSP domain protein [Dictyocaulus viviparus]
MGYELSIDPAKCRITASGGSSKHKLVNHCDRNLAYRIVFQEKSKYSVPMEKAVGVIEVGRTVDFDITRQAGKGPQEELAVEYFPVSKTGDASKSCYGELAGKTTMKLVSDG